VSAERPPAVVTRDLCKEYRLYPGPGARLLEWVARRPRHRVFRALTGVSFEQRPGEGLAVVGENGAGKSTLLKLLAGVTQPSSGSIEVSGRVAAILELGAGFHPDFTGRQNIRLNAALLGLTGEEIREREAGIVEWSELGEFIDRPVREYSSGMAVRLGFSIATQVDPDVLIVDEALSVGDGYFQKKSMDRMVAFVERGGTLLFCSHALYLASAFCQRAIWLRGGIVAAAGSTGDVVREYERYLLGKQRAAELRDAPAAGAGAPPLHEEAAPESLARIVSVRQLDGVGETPVYEPWAPFRLEIVFETAHPDLAFHVGALVASDDGVILSALGSRICGHPPVSGRTRYRTVLEVYNLPYQKGRFHLTALVLDERALHVYDRREIREAFAVIPGHYDPGAMGLGQRFHDLSDQAGDPPLSRPGAVP
jgi:ABC-type polysaccharide/polyol phosphate transport system ATPase subunit